MAGGRGACPVPEAEAAFFRAQQERGCPRHSKDCRRRHPRPRRQDQRRLGRQRLHLHRLGDRQAQPGAQQGGDQICSRTDVSTTYY